MEFPLKTKNKATTWSRDPTPGCTSGKNENSIVWKDTCTPVFTEALFTIAKTWCKTQNSGLCSKEEKPHDPIKEPSRCNMQKGLLSVAQTGDSDLLGGRAHTEQQIGQAFMGKKTTLLAYYIRVTKWLVTCLQSNPIGTNFAGFGSNWKQFYWYKRRGFGSNWKQFYWYKRRGLLFKLRRPRAFYWGWGIPPFHGKPKPKSRLPGSPSPGSPT